MSLPRMCGSGSFRVGIPLADEQVEVVQGARPDADEDVLGSQDRLPEVRDVLEDLGPPVGAEDHRLHRVAGTRVLP